MIESEGYKRDMREEACVTEEKKTDSGFAVSVGVLEVRRRSKTRHVCFTLRFGNAGDPLPFVLS